MLALPVLAVLVLTLIPNFVLVGLAVYLFILGRRLRERDSWTSFALSSLAAVEGSVAMIRFGGLSLAADPWFDSRILVVDPIFESNLLLVAVILLLVVTPVAYRRWQRQAEPSRPVPRIRAQALGHAFLILCLGGNWHFLALDPRHPSTAAVVSPDGRTEVCMVPYDLVADVNGHVLYRRKGAWAWKYCGQSGKRATYDQGCTFTWNPDSTEVVLELGYLGQRGSSRFVMRGDTLVQGEQDTPPHLTTHSAEDMFLSRADLLVAIDYFPGTSHRRIPWRMTANARGRVQRVTVQRPGAILEEMQLTPVQLELLREAVKASMSGPVADRGDGSGESFRVRMQHLGEEGVIAYRAETEQGQGDLPQVKGVERLLRSLLQWVPPPNPDQQRHLFQAGQVTGAQDPALPRG